MIAELDAFLWAFASMRDLSTPSEQQQLEADDVFLFLAGLRHVTTHQEVVASPNYATLLGRPFRRVIDEGGGHASAELLLDVDSCEKLFDAAAATFPKGRRGYEAAKAFLAGLRSTGDVVTPLGPILDEGLAVANHVLKP